MNIYARSIAALGADVLYGVGNVIHNVGRLAALPADRIADRLKTFSMVGR